MAKSKSKPKKNAKRVPQKSKATKKVGAKNSKGASRASAKRASNTKKKVQRGNKPLPEARKVSSVRVERKQKSKSSKVSAKSKRTTSAKKGGVTKRESGKIVYSKSRGNKQIDFTFANVRKIEKKKDLFKSSPEVKAKIDRMVKLKGKPPRGVVVIVSGKKLNEDGTKTPGTKTSVSPLDFVVNTANVQGYVDGILENMESDFEEWQDMEGEPGDGETDQYGTFDPDTINGVSIKFIY